MKVKLKLDTNQLKQLALAHVEKAVFGLLALVALIMMYKSFSLPKFTKSPQDFQGVTSRAQQALQTSEGTAVELVHKQLKPKEYLTIANKNTEKFLPDGYAWANVKPQVFATGGLRKEPEYLMVEDLHAIPSRNVFTAQSLVVAAAPAADADGDDADARSKSSRNKPPAKGAGSMGGGSMSKGRGPGSMGGAGSMGGTRAPAVTAAANNGAGLSYVVVTGRIPYAKQQKTYKDALGTAELRLTTDSQPEYLQPIVERAEEIAGVADKDLKWIKVSGSKAASTATKERLTSAADPNCDPRYQHRQLTEPLFTLAQGVWDAEVVVPEEFRLKDQTPEALATAAPEPAATEPAADENEIRPDDTIPASRISPAATAPGVRNGPGSMGGSRPGSMGGGRPGSMGGSRPGSMGGGAARPGSMGGGGNVAGQAGGSALTTDKYLFRFFDFSADAGKRYRYRVRLFLTNPNLGVDPRYLEVATLKDGDFRYTAPSAPTESASVPNGGSLIAGTYSPPAGPVESAANVVLMQFMEQGGQTAVKELNKLFRGQLANVEAKASEAMILDLETAELSDCNQTVKFQNNLMLLDVTAADKNKPADVLVMNGEGKLVVVSGEAEKDRYADLSKKIAKAKQEQQRASREENDDKQEERERDRERRTATKPDKPGKDGQDGNLLDAAPPIIDN